MVINLWHLIHLLNFLSFKLFITLGHLKKVLSVINYKIVFILSSFVRDAVLVEVVKNKE